MLLAATLLKVYCDVRDSDVRDSDGRYSNVRDSDVRDPDVRDTDVREINHERRESTLKHIVM
jgi:hypothetical protein